MALQKMIRLAILAHGLLMLVPTGTFAQESEAGLVVVDMSICQAIDRVARIPVGSSENFPAGLDRLYCFTRLTGADENTTITHVWFHEGRSRARVSLNVQSSDWRTWSSKALLPAWTGAWEVRVLDENGLVLKSLAFEVTGEPGVEEGM